MQEKINLLISVIQLFMESSYLFDAYEIQTSLVEPFNKLMERNTRETIRKQEESKLTHRPSLCDKSMQIASKRYSVDLNQSKSYITEQEKMDR